MRQHVERAIGEVARSKEGRTEKSSFVVSRQFHSGAYVFSSDFSELVISEKDSKLGDRFSESMLLCK